MLSSRLRASDSSAERLESIGHRAAAWIALGDLETRRNKISQRLPGSTAWPPRRYRMSASRQTKEVKMNKARMISFVVTLSVLVASSSGFARGLCMWLGKGSSWFEN